MQLAHPPRIALAQLPTPLQRLERASERWGRGRRIWVKRDDLTGTALTGNKLRKLEFIAGHARAHNIDTLITCGGLQSNHCRATALVCAQLGLGCHLILRGEAPEDPDGNFLLDILSGAAISCYPAETYVPGLTALFAHWVDHYRAQGRTPLCIPTGASDGLGIWGYIAAAEELARDMRSHGIDSATVVLASGSGGTQAGLTLGAALLELPIRVVGMAVCDDAQWFIDKMAADCADWSRRAGLAVPAGLQAVVNDRYIGPGYGRADPIVFQRIAALARLEGLVLDPVYTGKAFHGLVEELSEGSLAAPGEDVIFLHTGGLFGLFPQRHAAAAAVQT